MPKPLFDVVFRGDLLPGQQLPEVKERLAGLFKTDLARVEPLFSGAVVTLKRNLDAVTAEKYQAVLRAAGAAVELRAQQSQTPAARSSRGLSLAPLGADLLSQTERATVPAPDLDLRSYSVRPPEGYLLDEAERQPVTVVPDLGHDFDLAPVGIALLEATAQDVAPPHIVADFDLAEAGADLLKPEESKRQEPTPINTDHITLV